MTHLTREQFASALRKGQGRAMIHVREHGLDDVADLVLEACLHNQVYDQQIEDLRSDWLVPMFYGTAHYPAFREAILRALETEPNLDDLYQVCEIAYEMALKGDIRAKESLRDFAFKVAQNPFEDDWLPPHGSVTWVRLEGVVGLLDLARIYGHRLLQDPEVKPNPRLLFHSDGDTKEYQEALFQASKNDQSLKAYWAYLEREGVLEELTPLVERSQAKDEYKARFREEFPLERIIKRARKKLGDYPGRYTRFGRYATEAELEVVFDELLGETDEDVQTRLLWVFRRAIVPRVDPVLFDWADCQHEGLHAAAIAALAQVEDERVHALAHSKLAARDLTGPDREVSKLFMNNYVVGDAVALANALAALNTVDTETYDIHSLGFDILQVSEKHHNPDWVDALKWVYESSPCSNCRYWAVKELDIYQFLDDGLRYECQFDAHEATRDYVRDH